MSTDEADKARKAAMATIERESLEKTGLRSEVVTLYGGFRFHLYRYKSYTDVRIAFAPEAAVGFFGGDPDNFEYPRYCLDMALFRVYEDGKPANVEHFLTWAAEGVRDGELVFVAGHPGRTDRLLTVGGAGVPHAPCSCPTAWSWRRAASVRCSTTPTAAPSTPGRPPTTSSARRTG